MPQTAQSLPSTNHFEVHGCGIVRDFLYRAIGITDKTVEAALHRFGFRDTSPVVENQMEKNIKNERKVRLYRVPHISPLHSCG